VQIVAAGEWKGHRDGPFELAKEHLASIFQRLKERATEVFIDLDHAGGRAMGWLQPGTAVMGTDAQGRDAIFADIRWTPPTAEAIRNEEFRYFSPFVAFNEPDRVTGEPVLAEIWDGALTNNPFNQYNQSDKDNGACEQNFDQQVENRRGQHAGFFAFRFNQNDVVTPILKRDYSGFPIAAICQSFVYV